MINYHIRQREIGCILVNTLHEELKVWMLPQPLSLNLRADDVFLHFHPVNLAYQAIYLLHQELLAFAGEILVQILKFGALWRRIAAREVVHGVLCAQARVLFSRLVIRRALVKINRRGPYRSLRRGCHASLDFGGVQGGAAKVVAWTLHEWS